MKKWRVTFFDKNHRTVEKVILAASYYDAQRQIQSEYPEATNIAIMEEN